MHCISRISVNFGLQFLVNGQLLVGVAKAYLADFAWNVFESFNFPVQTVFRFVAASNSLVVWH